MYIFSFIPDHGALDSDTATTAPLFFFLSSTAPLTNPYSSDILHAILMRSLKFNCHTIDMQQL